MSTDQIKEEIRLMDGSTLENTAKSIIRGEKMDLLYMQELAKRLKNESKFNLASELFFRMIDEEPNVPFWRKELAVCLYKARICLPISNTALHSISWPVFPVSILPVPPERALSPASTVSTRPSTSELLLLYSNANGDTITCSAISSTPNTSTGRAWKCGKMNTRNSRRRKTEKNSGATMPATALLIMPSSVI
jgi:hypothetical protein